MTDDDLIERVVAAATAEERPTDTTLALLRAIVLTREEARRHALQEQARQRIGQMTDTAVAVLRFVFAVVA